MKINELKGQIAELIYRFNIENDIRVQKLTVEPIKDKNIYGLEIRVEL